MKKFNEFINENFKDLLKGKSDDEIREELNKFPLFDRIDKIKRMGLDKKFFPPTEELLNELNYPKDIEEVIKKYLFINDDYYLIILKFCNSYKTFEEHDDNVENIRWSNAWRDGVTEDQWSTYNAKDKLKYGNGLGITSYLFAILDNAGTQTINSKRKFTPIYTNFIKDLKKTSWYDKDKEKTKRDDKKLKNDIISSLLYIRSVVDNALEHKDNEKLKNINSELLNTKNNLSKKNIYYDEKI